MNVGLFRIFRRALNQETNLIGESHSGYVRGNSYYGSSVSKGVATRRVALVKYL